MAGTIHLPPIQFGARPFLNRRCSLGFSESPWLSFLAHLAASATALSALRNIRAAGRRGESGFSGATAISPERVPAKRLAQPVATTSPATKKALDVGSFSKT